MTTQKNVFEQVAQTMMNRVAKVLDNLIKEESPKKEYTQSMSNSHYYGIFPTNELGALIKPNRAMGYEKKVFSHEHFSKTKAEHAAVNAAKSNWKIAVIAKYGQIPTSPPFN